MEAALVVEQLRAAEESQCVRLSGRGAALALEAQCAEQVRWAAVEAATVEPGCVQEAQCAEEALLVATLSALVVEPLRAAEKAQCARLSGRGAALALEAQCAEPLR